MSSQEEVQVQLKRLATHRRSLALYLQQQAQLGSSYIPPSIIHGIEEARDNIRLIKETLRSWDISVENHPDDEGQANTSDDQPISISKPQVNKPQIRILSSNHTRAITGLVAILVGAVAIFLTIKIVPLSENSIRSNATSTSLTINSTPISNAYINTPTATAEVKSTIVNSIDPTETTLINLSNIKPTNLYTTGEGTFVVEQNKSLYYSGKWFQGTWFGLSLPDDFRVTIKFIPDVSAEQFILGLAERDQDVKPGYSVNISSKKTTLVKILDQDELFYAPKITITKEVNLLRSGQLYELVFERKRGTVNATLNGNVLLSPIDTEKDITKCKYLYLATEGFEGNQGKIHVLDLNVKKLN